MSRCMCVVCLRNVGCMACLAVVCGLRRACSVFGVLRMWCMCACGVRCMMCVCECRVCDVLCAWCVVCGVRCLACCV